MWKLFFKALPVISSSVWWLIHLLHKLLSVLVEKINSFRTAIGFFQLHRALLSLQNQAESYGYVDAALNNI